MTHPEFIELCRALRELGLTDITVGEYSAKFGAAPVKLLPIKPRKTEDLDPEEWRRLTALGGRR